MSRHRPFSFPSRRPYLLLATLLALGLTIATAHAQAPAPGNPGAVTWAQLTPTNDWSAQIINNLFPIGNAATGTQGLAGEQSAVGVMIGYLNGFVMLIAMAFVAYSTIIEVHRGAETGRVLTEKTSSWAPVRMGFAAIMMIPLSGGFTVGQAGVLKVALWGIGMATTVYDAGITAIGSQGLPILSPQIPDTEPIVADLIDNELCMALVNTAGNNTLIPPPVAVTGGDPVNGGFVTYNYALTGNQTGGPTCGSLTIRTAGSSVTQFDSVAMNMANNQQQDINYIVNTDIRPVAQAVAQAYWTDRKSADFEPLWNALVKATSDYTAELTQNAAQVTQALSGDATAKAYLDQKSTTETQMQDLGWAGAGAYFWKIAQLNGDTLSYLSNTATLGAATYDGLGPALSSDLAPVIQAAKAFSSEIAANATTVDGAKPPTGTGDETRSSGVLVNLLGNFDINQVLLNKIVGIMSPTQEFWENPFVVMIHMGDVMITAAEAPLLGIGALKLVTADNIWATIVRNVTPAGVAASEASAALNSGILSKLIFLICMALLVPGLILAFVMPMIPLTMWLAGVASWFILVIEAVIAVPLWMFAHMSYQGEGFHGRGYYGYSLLFNVLFRPVLMLLGLMLGYWLFTILSWLTFETFSLAGDFVLQQGYILTNLFGVIVLCAMLVTLEMAWAVMGFRMISQVPYQVVKWIGFEPASRVDMEGFALSTTTQGSRQVLNQMNQEYRGLVSNMMPGQVIYGGLSNGGNQSYNPPRLGGPGGIGGGGPSGGSGGGGAAPRADSTLSAATDVVPPASSSNG